MRHVLMTAVLLAVLLPCWANDQIPVLPIDPCYDQLACTAACEHIAWQYGHQTIVYAEHFTEGCKCCVSMSCDKHFDITCRYENGETVATLSGFWWVRYEKWNDAGTELTRMWSPYWTFERYQTWRQNMLDQGYSIVDECDPTGVVGSQDGCIVDDPEPVGQCEDCDRPLVL